MAERSFRDRFFTPPVARALTSPSGILSFGAGAAAGILLTVATGGAGLAMVGMGALGGLLGFGTRVAVAIPRDAGTAHIDPFGVGEPWRHAVKDALQARDRYRDAIATVRPGPLRDTLTSIGERLDDAVDECWQVAQQGQQLAEARKRIDDRETRWELEQAVGQIPPGGQATEIGSQRIASLQAQLASAQRMDDLLRSTYEQLELINARLDETVTQAIELSVTSTGGLAPVGQDVDAIVDNLTSLREAMGSISDPTLPSAPLATAPPPPPPSPTTAPPAADPGSGQARPNP